MSDNIHTVPGHDSAVVERKDLNQKFQGYALREIVDVSDLGNFLHNSQDESFELLIKLSLRMLEHRGKTRWLDSNLSWARSLSETVISIIHETRE
ncbi:hypothetical protein V1527DRAFT_478364 [Lipomyces starkeyi]